MCRLFFLAIFFILTSCNPNSYCNCEDFIKKVQNHHNKLSVENGLKPQMLSWFGIYLVGEELAETDKEKRCFEYISQMNDDEADQWMHESRCYKQSSPLYKK